MADLIRSIANYLHKKKALAVFSEWPPLWPRTITFDLRQKTVNGVAFGAEPAGLKPFGRPDLVDVRNKGSVSLTYQKNCLVLDLYDGVLGYAGVLLTLDQELYDLKIPKAPDHWAEALLALDGKELRVTAKTDEAALTDFLGRPEERDADDEEIILFYHFGDLALECELFPVGIVKRLNAYPEKENKGRGA